VAVVVFPLVEVTNVPYVANGESFVFSAVPAAWTKQQYGRYIQGVQIRTIPD
jgi:hypothetical protein